MVTIQEKVGLIKHLNSKEDWLYNIYGHFQLYASIIFLSSYNSLRELSSLYIYNDQQRATQLN